MTQMNDLIQDPMDRLLSGQMHVQFRENGNRRMEEGQLIPTDWCQLKDYCPQR